MRALELTRTVLIRSVCLQYPHNHIAKSFFKSQDVFRCKRWITWFFCSFQRKNLNLTTLFWWVWLSTVFCRDRKSWAAASPFDFFFFFFENSIVLKMLEVEKWNHSKMRRNLYFTDFTVIFITSETVGLLNENCLQGESMEPFNCLHLN